MARAEVRSRPMLDNWRALIDYLQTAMAHEQIEQFRILFWATQLRISPTLDISSISFSI
jgi:DNA repair protein RadC